MEGGTHPAHTRRKQGRMKMNALKILSKVRHETWAPNEKALGYTGGTLECVSSALGRSEDGEAVFSEYSMTGRR